MRILFLSAWFPYPANNGSKLRIYNLLKGLSQHHDVTLLSFTDRQGDGSIPLELQNVCRDVKTALWKPFAPDSLKARLGFFRLTPRSVLDTFSAEMAQLIKETLATGQYDLIIASQIMMAAYRHCFGDVPAIFEEVEVAVLYEQFAKAHSSWSRIRYGLTWAKHRRYLANLLHQYNVSTVVSGLERRLLQESVIGDLGAVEVIPNCVNVDGYSDAQADPWPNTLIYTGSFTYHANYQAMRWFIGEVYPMVKSEVPEVRLIITGDHANLPLPSAPDVELTGFVDDVRSYIVASQVCLVPIWTGGGTRLKILEAMALRTPIVATSKGAEGLDLEHEEHLLIADTPEAFARATLRLLKERGLRQELSDNAYQQVCRKYDWPAVMPRFLDLVDRVGNGNVR